MGYVVKMPKLGMDMDQGTVVEWFVEEGDEVTDGEVVAEIESEKTTGEVRVRQDGVLHHQLLAEGESTGPGGAVAVVGDPGEDVSDLLAEATGGAAQVEADESGDEAADGEAATEPTADAGESADESGEATADAGGAASDSVKATPRAKKRADELGVDLGSVDGTGPQGAVSEDDVEAAAESGGAAAGDAAAGGASAESGSGASDSVKATPRAKKRADELGVDLGSVDGTGPQGAVSEDDVEAAAESEGTSEAAGGEANGEPAAAGTAVEEGDERARHVFAPPRVRRLARELGVDIAAVEGTGGDGQVTEADVRAFAEGAGAGAGGAEAGAGNGETAAESVGTRDEERPMRGMRRTIASRLGESYRESVHVTVHRTADAEALLAAADAADEGLAPKISVTDVLLLALSATLDEHPAFNATYEDEVHRLHAEQNVCIAVDVEEGLVAPVVRGVSALSLSELAEKRSEVTQRALSGEFTMDDLSGGTFTVSNLGVLGVESFDPVINPPQVAILGVDTIEEEVVPVGDGDVGVRKRIGFDLSFDHRIVDGADAARFLGSLVEHVENPWPLVVAAGGR
jgi:pyruvate dehydrogenase E2 component (dihydrolipoamide acetyltransferase)